MKGVWAAVATAAFVGCIATSAAAEGPDWIARATGDGRLEYRLAEDPGDFRHREPQLAAIDPNQDIFAPEPEPIDVSHRMLDPTAEVLAIVDISEQSMTVSIDGVTLYVWEVSTGLGVSWTPTGTFNPFWLSEHHRSSLYDDAPMPFSVFFNGNIAVHGTTQIDALGSRASRGCVRLHPDNAEIFFEMVEVRDYRDVTIRVVR